LNAMQGFGFAVGAAGRIEARRNSP
jgi:hypothetical protein